jgi:alpha-tubulin suppressor-like RCC1 family protein
MTHSFKRALSVGIIFLFLFTGLFNFPLTLQTVIADEQAPQYQSLPVIALSAKGDASTVIKSDGSVWRWGYEDYEPFRLGSEVGLVSVDHNLLLKNDGTVWFVNQEKLEPVPDLDHVIKIASGGLHHMALKDDGTVWTWGSNHYSVLGYKTSQLDQLIPHQVPGLTEVKEIASSWERNAVIKQDGSIWYWGLDFDGTQGSTEVPHPFKELTGVKTLSLAMYHSLALKEDGTVWSWGSNNYGQLGDGTTEKRPTPIPVPGLVDIDKISARSFQSLALTKTGQVFAWGNNYTNDSHVPNLIQEISQVKDISLGDRHTLALKTDGSVWGWGNNQVGQLGNRTQISSLPTQSLLGPLSPRVEKVIVDGLYPEAGNKPMITINFSGRLDPASVNEKTIQLLDGGGNPIALVADPQNRSLKTLKYVPLMSLNRGVTYQVVIKDVKSTTDVLLDKPYIHGFDLERSIPPYFDSNQVSTGRNHTLVAESWRVLAWGDNTAGQLGDGTNLMRTLPTRVQGMTNPRAVSAGGNHNLAITAEGKVWAWGSNNHGQVGDGSVGDKLLPIKVKNLPSTAAISAGDQHSLALDLTGKVWAWGSNESGQLGNGTTQDQLEPIIIPELMDVIGIAAGGNFSLALKNDGTVWAWGDNASGQLGDESTQRSLVPVQVKGLNQVARISAGYGHSLALKYDSTVWAWGENGSGELGNGSQRDSTSPVQATGLFNITDIEAGYSHSMALSKERKAWIWGNNELGQLGAVSQGVMETRPLPLADNDIFKISAGGGHTFISKYGIGAVGFGLNAFGQIGDGSFVHRVEPTQAQVNEEFISYRLAGQNRNQTATAVSEMGWNYGSQAVVLTREDDFPDALTGAPLAYALNAPILLTNSKHLTQTTEEELNRLQPKEVYLLGSTGAISEEIEQKLLEKYRVIRLGGADRYETSEKIALYLKNQGYIQEGKAIIAYGQNFPDALAVSSLAAYQRIPILLSETNDLTEPTRKALQVLEVKSSIIVGGTGVISEAIEKELPQPARLGGSDRYETALIIAYRMGADTQMAYLATGKNFPDALSGSVLAARTNSPIILVDQDVTPDVYYYLSVPNRVRGLFILGGSGVVPEEITQGFLKD